MEERRDYAVLRFVDQNGWSYMVNDYAKGCSLMEYIKQGIRVEKETVFDWIRQLSKQRMSPGVSSEYFIIPDAISYKIKLESN